MGKYKYFEVLTLEDLKENVKKSQNIIKNEIKKAKKKVIDSWDKGRDGREFVDKVINIEHTSIPISVLENSRGIVINYHNTVVGIDNWGKIVHSFIGESKNGNRTSK